MTKLTRREAGKVMAALAAAQAARASSVSGFSPDPQAARAGSSASYIGPLTGVTPEQLAGRGFDPIAYSRTRYAEAPRQLRFQASSRPEAEAWQRTLRARLVDLLGGFPAERAALQPLVVETREFAGYRREKVLFNTRPGLSAVAYVLTPRQPAARLATVVCVPGHGRGVDDIVGIDDTGRDRTDKSGYQHDFALQVVEAGMAAVAIEPIAFGARRDPITMRKGLGANGCQPAAGAALLLGETMIGWRVWDVMRTVDYIETRSDLDASRVGLMGISGGGTVTVFGAALEPRVKAAFVSGYLNTFRDSVGSLSHCMDNYVPGILNWAEMHDVAGLIAPRPLFVESGEQDNIFPIEASRESFSRVREIYRTFGAEALAAQEVFPAEHSFWGVRGIPFLASHLQA